MEEIDIIELLKRVKEGKAPKKIEIDEIIYEYSNSGDICTLYTNEYDDDWLMESDIYFNTKINILDKPIIEEIHEIYDVSKLVDMQKFVRDIGNKTNEIIKVINKENKDE